MVMKDISSTALIELSIDLAKSLNSLSRFDSLLSTIRKTITCEAVALLAYKGDYLVPLAQQGLSRDTLGRRFYIVEHPRFAEICLSNKAVRFASNCPLPDPYDGLLIDREGDLPVHSCMGLPLYFEDKLLGVLTLDSLSPHVFDDIAERTLEVIAAMAAVSLNTALTLELLESNVQHSQQVVAALSQPNVMAEQNELIGQSTAMAKLKQEISLVASSEFNVLIEGESGVGKELVAHNIHQQSARAKSPLVYLNCAALPENLIESELFGHVKGAFTGAEKDRAGKFVIADSGTLFLDEIGELPLGAQSKLLRALQSNEIQAVGQDKVINVDVRIVAATNRDLALEVEKGRFRADLYHRLNVFPITVPPLRKRQGDIVLLSGFFAEKTKRKLGLNQLKLAPDVLDYLSSYAWPGNVRELEHSISRAALKASARYQNNSEATGIVRIEVTDCDQLNPTNDSSYGELVTPNEPLTNLNLRQHIDDYQRKLILRMLQDEQGNVSACAKRLSLDRANLSRLIKRLGIHINKVVNVKR